MKRTKQIILTSFCTLLYVCVLVLMFVSFAIATGYALKEGYITMFVAKNLRYPALAIIGLVGYKMLK